MISKEMIDEAARDCASLKLKRPKIAWVLQDVRDAFKEGAEWAQKKIFEQAARGFDEAWLSVSVEDYRGIGNGKTSIASIAVTSKRKAAEMLWQAAMLSSQAEIEQLKQRLSVAEMAVKKANDDHWFMINLIERYSSDKEQALKDVLERLKFRKPLYEKTLAKISAESDKIT